METPVSGSSDFDNSSISSGSSSFDSSAAEKSTVENPLIGEIGSNNVLHWKNLIENIKWKSVRRFSTIPLIGGYDLKNLRRKLGRNRSAEEEIDCGDSVVPKPSWRNFSRSELSAATDNFSPGELHLCFSLLLQNPLFSHLSFLFSFNKTWCLAQAYAYLN